MSSLSTILVVDDEVRSQETLRRTLEEEYEVLTASSADEAREILERDWVHVILCDQRMPGTSGVVFLKEVREKWPEIVRIIISGYTDTGDIIAGINEAGIYQYITKPWHPESLLLTVRAAAHLQSLQSENQRLALELRASEPVLRKSVSKKREQLRERYNFEGLIKSHGSPLEEICRNAERIAGYDIPILITGESGTGKELLGRAIHYASDRSDKAFVIENCGAVSDQILESELFGHKRGSFTGAYEDRIGLFEQADGGTIFLDEIGETSPAFQVKLLRVLQEGEIRPLGSSRTRRVDVRVISATNRELEEEVHKGRFREDLYYRLATFTLHMPALRDRPMDIPLIANHLLKQAQQQLGKSIRGFSPQALDLLKSYEWPGNVRDLQNEIYRMLALADGEELDIESLSDRVRREVGVASVSENSGAAQRGGNGGLLKVRLEAIECEMLRDALHRHSGNKSRAARELGLSRVGLRSKLQRYGLEDG